MTLLHQSPPAQVPGDGSTSGPAVSRSLLRRPRRPGLPVGRLNRSGRANVRRRLGRAGIYIAALVFAFWVLFPLLFALSSSFSTPSEIGAKPYSWWPQHLTFANYAAVLTGNDNPFHQSTGGGFAASTGSVSKIMPALGNSLLVASILVVTNLVIGGLAGYAFSRYYFRGSKVAFFWLLLSRVVPPITLITAFFEAANKLHLFNTPWALVISYNVFTLPLCVWLLKSYFDGTPREVEDAAKVDGAGTLRTLWAVVVPIARPGLIAAGLLVFLEAWSEFFYSLVLTNELTVPPLIVGLQGLMQFSWTLLAAAIMLSLLPPLVIALVFQRYLVSGLASGSIR